MIYDISSQKGFKNEEKVFESYDEVSWFILQKIKQDIPFAKVDYYINSRNLKVITITNGELTIGLELEFGYVEFCGIEYRFNLLDIVKLVKAIQYYLIKYTTVNLSDYMYIEDPWGW